MGFNFIAADRDQPFLLPPDMRDWLGEEHLVWVVLDAVAEFDLSGFERAYRANGQGAAAFDPAMMAALLLYAYSTGVRSSRQIERRCVEDVAFRVITAGLRPDHATISRFRARHEAALKDTFSQVLRVLRAAGMLRLGLLALDGTKIGADASWSANRTRAQLDTEIAELDRVLAERVGQVLGEAAALDAAEDARFGPGGREELTPRELAGRSQRRARLQAARERLDGEQRAAREAQQAKLAAWQARKDAGVARPGGKPGAEPPGNRNRSEARANATDPQARVMRTRHTLTVGYNAQAVVTADQVIVGVLLTQAAVDQHLLLPGLGACRAQLGAAGIHAPLGTVCADAGYANENDFAAAETAGLRVLIPLAKDTPAWRERHDPAGNTDPARATAPGRDLSRLPATARAQAALDTEAGRCEYRQRGRTVEPVFGQIKTRQNATRFTRRGRSAAESEWHLLCAAHNLRKLHTHRTRPT